MRWVSVLVAGLLTAACDITPDRANEPWQIDVVKVIDDAGPPEVSRRAPIRLQFDRRLSPWSIDRDSVRLFSGSISEFVFPSFDPIAQQLSIDASRDLLAGVSYVIRLDGLTDLDGNLLPEPLLILVRATDDEPEAPPDPATFAEVAPLLLARCATAGCHDATTRAAGVDLATAQGIADTVIDQPSRQVASPDRGAPIVATGLLELPIVDGAGAATSLSRSYLIYKVLGDAHVLGEPMPPRDALAEPEVLLLSRWIAGGAALE